MKPLGSKEFFESLMDSEEYAIIMMRTSDYHQMDDYFKNNSTLSVKQNNKALQSDSIYLELSKKKRTAKNKLTEYEQKINHGNTSK